ncbi:hypothetical protein Taro_037231 [Colocasia esculenta]|uniref:Uncharacterized protein n=1 Tax=Colocasia esculenta TaxID=4460 RepID=A0A843W3L8_COLES|nr:hypothetical protein [Colocasia esculenta]
MEHRSDHERPESQDTVPTSQTSTRSRRNNQVSPRETPSNHVKHRLTTGTITSDLHKVEGLQVEPPCTSDTP